MGLFSKIFLPSKEGLQKAVEAAQRRVDSDKKALDWAKGVLAARMQQSSGSARASVISDAKKAVERHKATLANSKENLKRAKERLKKA